MDLALTATPEETITETGLVMDPSFSIRFIQAIRLPTPVGRAPSVQTFGLEYLTFSRHNDADSLVCVAILL